jgi:hypothetical protein
MEAQRIGTSSLCLYCREPVLDERDAYHCPGCQQIHHLECWEELGGCTVYGCPRMVPVEKAPEIQTFWGVTEKTCPICAETIAVADRTCPFCGTAFDDDRPVTREQMLHRDQTPPAPLRRTAAVLLAFSVLGVTTPLTLLSGGMWYLMKRKQLAEERSNAHALTLIALIVSALYVVLIVAGVLAFQLAALQGVTQ